MQVDLLEIMWELVSSFGLNMTVIKSPDDNIDNFDLGIRKAIMEEGVISQMVKRLYNFCEEGALYFVNDCFDLEYCLFQVPLEERKYGDFVLIGPYQKEYADEYQLNLFVQTHNLGRGNQSQP